MTPLFYDDPIERRLPTFRSSIFLAGPTARVVGRTPWRAEALALLEARGFDGAVVIPEFRDARFEDAAPERFGQGSSPAPNMKVTSYNILSWETAGIEGVTVVLFWMPFCIGDRDDPASLPGFTTHAEVSREMARAPERIVLGMPPRGVESSGHIRYHAHQAGIRIWETLKETVDAAVDRVGTKG